MLYSYYLQTEHKNNKQTLPPKKTKKNLNFGENILLRHKVALYYHRRST